MAWPSLLRGALHTGLAPGQARAAPLEAGPSVCDLKKRQLSPQIPSPLSPNAKASATQTLTFQNWEGSQAENKRGVGSI